MLQHGRYMQTMLAARLLPAISGRSWQFMPTMLILLETNVAAGTVFSFLDASQRQETVAHQARPASHWADLDMLACAAAVEKTQSYQQPAQPLLAHHAPQRQAPHCHQPLHVCLQALSPGKLQQDLLTQLCLPDVQAVLHRWQPAGLHHMQALHQWVMLMQHAAGWPRAPEDCHPVHEHACVQGSLHLQRQRCPVVARGWLCQIVILQCWNAQSAAVVGDLAAVKLEEPAAWLHELAALAALQALAAALSDALCLHPAPVVAVAPAAGAAQTPDPPSQPAICCTMATSAAMANARRPCNAGKLVSTCSPVWKTCWT